MTRPRCIAVVLLAGLVVTNDPQAQTANPTDRKYTVITGSGQALYRIAIPLPLGPTKQATTLQRVLGNDLMLVGWFKPLNPKGFLADLKREGLGIEPKSWLNVGAQAVVKARVVRHGKRISTEWYLYEPAKGKTPVLRKTYAGRRTRRLAHRFGDDIVKFYTKQRGVFTTRIAFTSRNRRRRSSQIYVVDFDGHGAHRVSRTGSQNVLAAWSPSGRLAYTSFLWRNPDLYITGRGRPKRISRRRGVNMGAEFSPSGNQIALTLSKDGNNEIYVINLTGAIIRRLTRHPGIDSQPTWSPDGSRIAFVSNRAGAPQIFVMSSRGGAAKRLTFAGNYNQEPAWCPAKDTPLIAYTSRAKSGNYDILTKNVKTGELKRLTQGQGSNKGPTWAPNGRLLAFSSSRGGLWIMRHDGLNQHRIYRGSVITPAWSRR